VKPPKQCTCSVHLADATNNYSKYSRNPKLLRRCRLDSLNNAQHWRKQAETEPTQKEKEYLESVAVCAEWNAWVCLTILREIRKQATA
jgi:hypothetical protein